MKKIIKESGIQDINKIAKRYADRHLTDYTKDVQKKDEEQFGDNIELKVFNFKKPLSCNIKPLIGISVSPF